jgi:hypothetical protein
MRWVGYVACVGEMRNAYRILIPRAEGRDYLGDKDNSRRTMLKLM